MSTCEVHENKGVTGSKAYMRHKKRNGYPHFFVIATPRRGFRV